MHLATRDLKAIWDNEEARGHLERVAERASKGSMALAAKWDLRALADCKVRREHQGPPDQRESRDLQEPRELQAPGV